MSAENYPISIKFVMQMKIFIRRCTFYKQNDFSDSRWRTDEQLRAVPAKKTAPPGWTAVAFRPPHPADILLNRPPMGPDFLLPQYAAHPGFWVSIYHPTIRIWKIIEQQFLSTTVFVPNLKIANNLTQKIVTLPIAEMRDRSQILSVNLEVNLAALFLYC